MNTILQFRMQQMMSFRFHFVHEKSVGIFSYVNIFCRLWSLNCLKWEVFWKIDKNATQARMQQSAAAKFSQDCVVLIIMCEIFISSRIMQTANIQELSIFHFPKIFPLIVFREF